MVPVTTVVALLGLAGLLAWLVARGIVQPVERDVQNRLAAAGHHWARVAVSGLNVTLTGTPPTTAAADHAVQLVESTESATWLGLSGSVWSVTPAFDTPEAGDADGWVLRRDTDVLWLTGAVRDATTRDQLLARAGTWSAQQSPPVDVRHHLRIAPSAGGSEHAPRALSFLAACTRGRMWFEDGAISAVCEAHTVEQHDALEADLERLAATTPVGRVDVYLASVADACDAVFQSVASRGVHFVTGKASLQPQSASTIYDLARAIRECPGTIRVSAHTDNTPNPVLSVHLSQMRADTVREALIRRGVPPERLVAVGMGAHDPRKSNATPEGRSANRRVELAVMRPGDG